MIRIIKLVFILVFLTVVGLTGFIYYKVFQSAPTANEDSIAAHEALMGEKTIAIGQLNIAQLVHLESLYLNLPNSELQEEYAVVTENPYGKWQSYGIDPRKDIDQLVGAAILTSEGVGWGAVLIGRFDSEKINRQITKDLKPVTENWGSYALHTVEKIDVDTCRPESKKTIYVDDTYIVVSPPEQIKGVITSLYTETQSAPKFAKWLDYQDKKIVSALAVIPSEEEVKKSKDMLLNMGQKASKGKAAAFSHVFFGSGISLARKGAYAELRVDYRNEVEAKKLVNQLKTELKKSKGSHKKNLPHFSALHESIGFREESRTFIADVNITPETIKHLKELPGELFGVFLSGLGGSMKSGPKKKQDEIEDKPTVYKPLANLSLPAYKKDATFAEKSVAATSGPFAIAIKKIEKPKKEKDSDKEEGLSIEIEAIGTGLLSVPKDSKNLKFFVTDILDSKGKSLLMPINCGRKRPSKPEFFNAIGDEGVFKASKKVILKSGVNVEDVAKIESRIDIALPKKVEKVAITKVPTTVKKDKVAVDIKSTTEDSIKYHIHGEPEFFLEARALNAKNQVLRKSWSSQSGFMFGSGQSKTQSYRGSAKKFEIYLMSEAHRKSFSIKTRKVMPRSFWTFPPNASAENEEMKPFTLAQFDALSSKPLPEPTEFWAKDLPPVKTGPFQLYINPGGGFSKQILVVGPQVLQITDYPQALEFVIEKVIAKDGRVLTADTMEENKFGFAPKWNFLEAMKKANWRAQLNTTTKKWEPTNEDWYTKAEFRLSNLAGIKIKEIESVEAKLILRIPKAFSNIKVNPIEGFNDEIIAEGVSGKFLAITNSSFDISFSQGGKNLVAVKEFTREGQPYQKRAPALNQRDDQIHSSIWNRENLGEAELIFATEWDETSWPVKIDF